MEPSNAKIRAVLFDFDGTLVDSEYLHHEAWLEAVEPWGVSVSWRQYVRDLVGISDRRACEFFLGRAGIPVTPECVEAGRARKHAAYRRRSVRELSIHPQAKNWIRANRDSVPMGVVSSSEIPDVVPILERQGVAECLEFVICGDDVERLKPDPMPYLLALDKLRAAFGIDSGKSCLAFEDSATGTRSAKAAGLTVHRVESPDLLPRSLAAWFGRIAGAVAATGPSLAG